MEPLLKPRLLKITTNKLYYFTNPEKVWKVEKGTIDIYLIELNANKEATSSRKFLYRAERGDLVLSLNTQPFLEGVTLMATAQEAMLIEFPVNSPQLHNLPFIQLSFEKWVDDIAEYCLERRPPIDYKNIVPGKGQNLKKGTISFFPNSLIWAKVVAGEFNVLGHTDSTERNRKMFEQQYFPVSRYLPVEALGKKNILDVFANSNFPVHHLIKKGINPFRAYTLEEITEMSRKKKLESSQQIQKKINLEEHLFVSSLQNLNKILNKKAVNQQANKLPDEGALLVGALETVITALGRTIRVPKTLNAKNAKNALFLICENSNIRARKVILRGEWWKEENGHLLVFDRATKNPRALIQKKPQQYQLINQENGVVKSMSQEVAFTLDPEAYMFFPNFSSKINSFTDLLHFALKDFKTDAWLLLIAAFLGSLIGLLMPIFSNLIFDDVIPTADRSFLKEMVAILLMIAVIKALLGLVQGILLIRLETKTNVRLQAGLMDHLIRLPVRFFKEFSAGDLTMRALTANAIRQIASNTLLSAILSGSFSIVNLFLLFYYESRLAWIGIGLSIVAILFIIGIGLLKLKYDRDIAEVQGRIQGLLFEFLSGIDKIRIGGAEKRIFSIWANKFGELKALNFNSGQYQNFVEVFKGSYPFLTNIIFFFFIYYYFELAKSSQEASLISVGAFIAFVTAFGQFLGDCLSMSFAFITSLNIIPLYERVQPIFEATPETQENFNDVGVLKGNIEFNQVSFRYKEDLPLVLDDVSFTIKAGEMVAFVGPSGSGKSTILRILLGFEKPETGSVYYDGQEFLTLNKDLLRKQLGVVLQNGALLPGSILKNIVGNSSLTVEQAWEAAKMSGIEEDIKEMPMGIHTVISEGAGTISGGQKQRLMIARALVNRPRIIMMDEATSALDNRTQSIVKESLDRLQATRIVVAHRLSTIKNSDRIFVMDKGKIVEQGDYDSLIKQEGLFAKLAKRQIL